MADKKIVQVDQTGPIYAFLDTNAFYNARFSYDNGGMLNRMMSYSKDEKLIILYSSIVKREAFSYVETGLSEFARQAKNQIKNNDAIKAAPKELINEITKTILGIPAEAKSFLERFFETATEIPDTEIPAHILFDKYFKKKAPFEDKKKNEFPDAAIAYGLENYAGNNTDLQIYVVSNDQGFQKSIEHIDNIVILQEPRDLLDLVSQRNTNYQEIIDCVSKSLPDLEQKIEINLTDIDWSFADRAIDKTISFNYIESVNVDKISTSKICVEYIDAEERETQVALYGFALVSLDFEYTDFSREWYDELYHVRVGTENGRGKCSLAAQYSAYLAGWNSHKDALWEFQLDNVESEDNLSLISSQLCLYCDEAELPDYYCPDCSQPIELENDGGNGFCSICATNH